jgi:hypothetical protein
MKKIPYTAALLLGALLLIRCIDEIRLDIDTDQRWVVIDGQVTDSMQVCTLKISWSAVIGVGNDNILTPIAGCTVQVKDDEGGEFYFMESAEGIYTREMRGELGKSYHVEVKMPDGKTLLSRPAQLPKAPALLPISAKVTQKTTISATGRPVTSNQLAVSMNTDVSGSAERPYLRWRASGEYEFREAYPMALNTKVCYIRDNVDFNNIRIFNTNELSGSLLSEEPFLDMNYNYRFAHQYCLHLFQYAISEEEFRYWEKLRSIVSIDGSLFDPPPGTVQGNLYNPDDPDDLILGYFSVAGVAYRRDFLNVNLLGFFVEPRCSSLPFRPQYPECRECTDVLGSSLVQPDYWE